MTLDATAEHTANGLFVPGTIGAAARSEARILDIESGIGTPRLAPDTVVQSIGERVTVRTFEFTTAIGHHLQLDVGLLISAGVFIEPFRFEGQASAGTAVVIADHTARFFHEPSGDVRLVSESGHDYALSGSTAAGLLCYRSKLSAGGLCSADAPLNAGRACRIEESCGGNSLDDALAETSYCLPNRFPAGRRVSLRDPLEPTPRIFDVKKPVSLCAPHRRDGDEPEPHLLGYQIALAKGRCADGAPLNPGGGCARETDCSPVPTTTFCALQPKSGPHLDLSVSNPFHASPLLVGALEPDRLLVPTAKDPTDPPGPPDPSRLDHYKCYPARVGKNAPKFEPIPGIPVENQFTSGAPRLVDLKKPTRLCLSAEKDGVGRNDENAHLVCHQAAPAKKVCATAAPVNPGGGCTTEEDCGGAPGATRHCAAQAKFAGAAGLFVNNQFGGSQVDATKEEEVCVPSTLGGGG